MKPRDHRRLTSLTLTLLLHAAVLGLMASLFLRYDGSAPAERKWPPVDSAEILFGGEYVMAGDIAEEGLDAAAAPVTPEPAAASPEPVAEAPEPEPHVAATQPSPAKSVATPSQPRRAQTDTRADERRRAEEKRREQEAARINSRVNFGSGTGKSGQPDGNSADGAVSGVTASGLGNRQVISLPLPPKGPMGKIVVSIKVDRRGNVTDASYLSGSGAAAASATARNQCLAAARRSRFSASDDAPASQRGTLTYVYR